MMNKSNARPSPKNSKEFRRWRSIVQKFQNYAAIFKDLAFSWALPAFFLVVLSFIGTYTGLKNVLAAGDNNTGTAGVILVMLFVVVMTLVMVAALSSSLSNQHSIGKRIAFFATYVSTMLFSVAFGFAFWWNMLEARGQSIDDAIAELSSFENSAALANAKLENAISSLSFLSSDFAERAKVEADEQGGNQCGEKSPGGPGPRARHLDRTSNQITSFVTRTSPRIDALAKKSDAVRLRISELNRIGDVDSNNTSPEAREELFRVASMEAREVATAITAFAESAEIRNNIALFGNWANEYSQPNLIRTEPGSLSKFVCYNAGAANSLLATSSELSSLPKLEAPRLINFAGPKATKEALDRFTYSLSSKIPILNRDKRPNRDAETERAYREGIGDGMRSNQQTNVKSVGKGLRSDDYKALIAALFVDGLLFLSTFWSRPTERFSAYKELLYEVKTLDENPLDIVLSAADLANDARWKFLQPYLFVYLRDDYIAMPSDRTTEEVRQLYQIITAWKVGKLVRPSALSSRQIAKQLKLQGSSINSQKFSAWRFTRGAFDRMLLAGFATTETDNET